MGKQDGVILRMVSPTGAERDATDASGKPFPIVHLRLPDGPQMP